MNINKYKIAINKRIGLLKIAIKALFGGGTRRFFLFQTPTHSNIGDHAIAEAEICFLRKTDPKAVLLEVNQHLNSLFLLKMRWLVRRGDTVFLHGGGNFGNQYLHEEEIRRSVIQAFPHNKIISFPQTIYFTSDETGKRELEKSQKIIAHHKHLTLIAREHVSYELMTGYFPSTPVLLTPDIVLSLNKTRPILPRNGILMVLRSDEERILTDDQQARLQDLVGKYSDKITYSDMHYHKGVENAEERDKVLDFKFNQFKTAQLVITDRLHGMVLAAITQTPCIAFSNYNQKVSGTYEWIKELNYIKFRQKFPDNMEDDLYKLLNLQPLDLFNPAVYNQHFDEITRVINE